MGKSKEHQPESLPDRLEASTRGKFNFSFPALKRIFNENPEAVLKACGCTPDENFQHSGKKRK